MDEATGQSLGQGMENSGCQPLLERDGMDEVASLAIGAWRDGGLETVAGFEVRVAFCK
jgi:hypothetical protein